jgi:hypothetical protein
MRTQGGCRVGMFAGYSVQSRKVLVREQFGAASGDLSLPSCRGISRVRDAPIAAGAHEMPMFRYANYGQ